MSVTVSAGGTQTTDFGETQSSLAGSVFVDRDSDGVHAGSGEEGIAGVTVTLSGTNDAGDSCQSVATNKSRRKFSCSTLFCPAHTH